MEEEKKIKDDDDTSMPNVIKSLKLINLVHVFYQRLLIIQKKKSSGLSIISQFVNNTIKMVHGNNTFNLCWVQV